jgi:cobalamin biosynthesis protein CobD/CbiB
MTTDRMTTDQDLATEPLAPDKSLGELFGDLTSDLSHLFRQEVELAKTEARGELKQAGRGVGMLAGAGVSAWIALLMLSLALAWLIDKSLDRGLSFAIVGAIWAAVAAVLAIRGKQQAAAVKPLPKTVQTLKEDAQWVKTQKS